MRRESLNTEAKGRDAVYSVCDTIASGMNKIIIGDDGDVMDVDTTEESGWVNLEDGMEVEDNGSLDVD